MNTLYTNQCSTDASYCRFGAETLLKLVYSFTELIDGVIADKDTEYVHKTRVNSRRLRAAMPIFRNCFSKKQFKIWNREIKQVTCLLSSARDLDVQIAFIEQYIEKLDSPAERTAMNRLLKYHRSCRRNIQGDVEAGLEELKNAGTLGDISTVCKQTMPKRSIRSFDSASIIEKAHWHISFRLADFLAMQNYVNMENASLQHHQMRIAAKKLRYTMEIFASLYPRKLAKEIQTMKVFQDELGELHDCVVWIEYIPKFKGRSKQKTAKSDLNLALDNFFSYILKKKAEHYHRFKELWNGCIENGFFEKLRKTTSQVVIARAKTKTQKELNRSHLRIAVLSDIHANLHALQSVLDDAEQRGANVLLNAGDSIGYGAYLNEVVELLCQKGVISILGNYDLEVLENRSDAKGEKKLAFAYARKELSSGARSYLEYLPRELRLQAADKKLLVTHGSPRSIDEHIYHDTSEARLKALADKAEADIVVVGHSHEQFLRAANNVNFLNPGSIGRPGDGNPQAAYAILDFNPFRAQLIRLDYPVKAAAQALRKQGLPESYAQMLLRGVSLDDVLKRNRSKEKVMTKKCREVVAACEEFSKNRWPDMEHYLQVTNLALALFDGLASLHKLGKRERCWLECAAVLHDIGLSAGGGKHNKKSAELILNDTLLPLSSNHRRIIAVIARYHRGALPKPSQYLLVPLNRQITRKIFVLASLLRLADSLDYTHEGTVKLLGIRVTAKTVTAECFSNVDLTLEQQAFNKKKDLFEKVFNRKMMLEWKRA